MKPLVPMFFLLVTIGTRAVLWSGEMDADKARLQGTWVAVNLIDKGKTDERLRSSILKLILKDDMYTYQVDKNTFKARFKLDATTKPKSIDVTFEEGPLKGKTMPAIYSLERDELRTYPTTEPYVTSCVGSGKESASC